LGVELNGQLVVAVLAGLGVTALLLGVIGLLRRRARVLRQLSFPLSVAALAAGLKVMTLFGVEKLEPLAKGVDWLFLLAGVLLAIRIAAMYYLDVHLFHSRGVRLPPLLPPVLVTVAYLIAGFVILRVAYPGLELQGIVATSAITSLVLGLALQPILGNFFSGLVISLERPYRINDWIKVGDVEARVVDITWRTTHLRTRDNDNLIYPNAEIANREIINFYYPHPLHLERVEVGVHYRTPPYRVKAAMLAAASRVDGLLEKPSPEVFVLEFGDSAILYELRVWIEDIAGRPKIESDIRTEIWEEFHRRDITIPFPIRTLEIEPKAGTLALKRAAAEAESKPQARLYVSAGPDRGRTLHLGEDPITIGRSSACDLSLKVPQASKEHCRIEWRENGYWMVDLGSQFGTQVNGKKAEERRLQDLDEISIGGDSLRFESHG
jgi:small-conductance mechanosensitive channel